jgi:outer membrane lipoprotein-sorting protein
MKRFLRLSGAVVLTIMVYGSAYAKLPPELLKKLTQSHSINESKIKDMVKVETIETSYAAKSGQTETTTYSKGNNLRIETKMTYEGKTNTTIMISDGINQWLIMNNMKMKQGKLPDKSETAKIYQKELDKNADKLNVIKTEILNGKNCYVVENTLTEKEGKKDKFLMWLDKDSALTYQVIGYDASGKEQIKIIPSDYRNVLEDLKMPFKTEMYTGNKLIMKTVVKSIKVNQGLADTLFDVSSYKEMGMGAMTTQMMGGAKTEPPAGNATGGTTVDSGTVKNEPVPPSKSGGFLNSALKSKFPF